ncbi:MAG: aminotransferase class V-fold PLP-dependent enzyme [Gammaproteobacteria bacterium]|nr:aminotransferase class V-fold PLP-dependent enzyme [Gammaproteobacteria bacterium]
MPDTGPLVFGRATEAGEFDQIHGLNYEIFVEEIPQHEPNDTRRLIDRFHAENTYFVCRDGDRVVGMVAARARRPFSLDDKLDNLDAWLPPHRSVCELRLLAVRKAWRHTRVFRGLMGTLARWGLEQGHDLAVISGTLRQQRLYAHLGFHPFGPVVGADTAPYQPMYLTLNAFRANVLRSLNGSLRPAPAGQVNLLPGPVDIAPAVHAALAGLTISHRSGEFLDLHQRTRAALARLVNARDCAIVLGSGTLANDIVAAQLTLLPGRGLVLANGEFGERLIDHARRMRLPFAALIQTWGEPFAAAAVRARLEALPDCRWLWAVHAETSTGMLNDTAMLAEICRERGVLLNLDCISAIGAAPVDLAGVHLASGVSGKGLGGFTGLGLVFHNHELPPPQPDLPRYLDLRCYAAHDGVPYSTSSNLVNALHAAVTRLDPATRFRQLAGVSAWLRAELRGIGLTPLVEGPHAFAAVLTLPLPAPRSSREIGERLLAEGFLISFESGYLLRRNWIQICLMREASRELLEPLVAALARCGAGDRAAAG